MLRVGDVGLVRTTGEKVYIFKINDDDTFVVIRPKIEESGAYTHIYETYPTALVSTLDEFAKEQVGEMLLKMKAQTKLQAEEARLQQEAEDELPAHGEPILKEPEVN